MSSERPAVITVQSVPLTREKLVALEREIEIYHKAVNYTIKQILKQRITTPTRALELLRDEIARKFIHLGLSSGPLSELTDKQLREVFAKRFTLPVISSRVKIESSPEETRNEFVDRYEVQYCQDVIKTARAEIGRHKRMAKMIRSIRDKPPFFKHGRLIFSGFLVMITPDAKTLLVLTTDGQEIPVVFDKPSRNRVVDTLEDLAHGRRKFERARISLNREGYVDIDFRMRDS